MKEKGKGLFDEVINTARAFVEKQNGVWDQSKWEDLLSGIQKKGVSITDEISQDIGLVLESLKKLYTTLPQIKGGEKARPDSSSSSADMPLYRQAQRFFTALNEHNLDEVVAMISPTADIRTPLGSFTGGEAYREWMMMHFRAMPDFTHELRGMAVESGQNLAFEIHATGTHTGPLALPDGDVPPTGRSLDVSASDFWRFEDGLIVEYRLYFNLLDFLGQLGLAPATSVPPSSTDS